MPVTNTPFNLGSSNYNAQRQEKVDALSPKAKRLPTWVKPVAYTALTIAGLAAIYFAGPAIFSSSTPVPNPGPTPKPTPKSPEPTPTPTPRLDANPNPNPNTDANPDAKGSDANPNPNTDANANAKGSDPNTNSNTDPNAKLSGPNTYTNINIASPSANSVASARVFNPLGIQGTGTGCDERRLLCQGDGSSQLGRKYGLCFSRRKSIH